MKKIIVVLALLVSLMGCDFDNPLLGKTKVEYIFDGVGIASFIGVYFEVYHNVNLPFKVVRFLPDYDLIYIAKCKADFPITLTIKNNDKIFHIETGAVINFEKHEE